MIDLAVEMEQNDCPFVEATCDHSITFGTVHWEFDTAARQLETRMVAEAEAPAVLDAGLSTVQDHGKTSEITLLRREGERAHIRTVTEETHALTAIRDNRGYITGPFQTADGSELWHVGFDRGRDADDALADLDRENDFDVLERSAAGLPNEGVEHAGAAMTLIEGCRDLSETERETLEAAVSAGYFESPRDATLGSLAEEFDVSKPAVSKNLRRGERKMIERVIAVLDDIDSDVNM